MTQKRTKPSPPPLRSPGQRPATQAESTLHAGLDDPNIPHLSLKYWDTRHQCLSAWRAADLDAFCRLAEKLQGMTWTQIAASGGKAGSKTGLGYTVHANSKLLPNQGLVPGIDPGTKFFELRLGQRCRVHGFRSGPFFFLVWLDHLHEVYPA